MSEVLSDWRSKGQGVRGSEGQRFRGSEVLSSRWFDIWTSECYRVFELFNRKLALMYNGRAEARMREWEYWNGLIYWKWKGENWDEDMKMNSEFKRTKMEWWRQMKTEMWSGFSEVVWSSESDRKCVGGFGGYLEFGVWVSVVSEYWRMVRNGVRGVVGDQSWIRQDLSNRMGILRA